MAPSFSSSDLGVALLALVQFAGVLIWGAGINQRVKRLENDVKPVTTLSNEMAVLGERMKNLSDQIREFKAATPPFDDPVPGHPARRRRAA